MGAIVFRLSTIDYVLADVARNRPKWLPDVVNAIQEEMDRLDRGDYTAKEKEIHELAARVGESAGRILHETIVAIALKNLDEVE